LESLVKNCGGSIHKEIAHKDMIESLKELVKVNKNDSNQIRDKVLEIIQCWSYSLGKFFWNKKLKIISNFRSTT
jgi:growth factor-regulated tyrosine kinase substrate